MEIDGKIKYLTKISYYNIFFYYNMSFTARTVYEKDACQIGQVTKINITNEGLLRIFYNDTDGNMYCSVSRQSNYKQIILNSSRKRTVFDVSNTSLNNFNQPYYGGSYHIEELSGNYYSSPDISGGKIGAFYTLRYDNNTTHGIGGIDKGPWITFSEPILQSYINQGDSSNNSIYDTRGYSSVLNTKNKTYANQCWNWYNQFAYFFAISSDISGSEFGMNEVGMGVPDLWNFTGDTDPFSNTVPLPLNNNFIDSNLTDMSGSPPSTSINSILVETAPYGGWGQDNIPGNNRRATNYYFASFSPKYIWVDANNNATSNTDGLVSPSVTDEYYKGNFVIWVDTSGNSDTSGNVYLGSKNRSLGIDFSYNIIPKFKNSTTISSNGLEYIKNVFVDIDADVSKNAINPNFNNIYSKPYFVACSDVSNSIVFGNAPYDISYGNVDDINIYQFTTKSTVVGAKYCKIKLNHTSSDWTTTRWHIVYHDIYGASSSLAIANGIGNNSVPTQHYHYTANTTTNGSGKYPAIDIDSLGKPHIAFFGPINTSGNLGIHYIAATNNLPSSANWTYTLIEDFGVTNINSLNGAYQDLSNNQPISLKISPYDDSVHIAYQHPKTNTFSLSYWTNSSNILDISAVDTSLNYVGIRSYGKTIDMSRASVEVYWDLSSSFCLFSRDFQRYDTDQNRLLGLTSPLLKSKSYTNPLGARLSDLGYINKTASGWNSPVNFRFNEIQKLYIVVEAKLTNINVATNTLFCLGSQATGGFICGWETYSPRFTGDISGAIFMGIKGDQNSSPKEYLHTAYDPSASVPPTTKWYNGDTLLTESTQPNIEKNKLYRFEFYYNKTNYFLDMRIKNMDDDTDPRNKKWCRYSLFTNGGFNITDGFISIGTDNHTTSSNPWNGEINKVSVYATDISNIPMFDLSRNGEILIDCSSSPFSSFFDNSGNEGLVIEPSANTYQVVNAINSLNIGDISGQSDIKEVLLNDIYYLQRIYDQNVSQSTNPGQYIITYDRFKQKNNGYYELWAIGYTTNGSGYDDIVPSIWASNNGGFTWNKQDSFTLGVTGKALLDINTYIDPSGGKWVFICGENYKLYYSNNYNGNTVGGTTLGTIWHSVPFSNIPFGSLESGTAGSTSSNNNPVVGGFYEHAPTSGIRPNFNCIKVVDTYPNQNIIGTDSSSNDFHIWLGTSKYNGSGDTNVGTSVRITCALSYYESEAWWQLFDSNNNSLIYTGASWSPYFSNSPSQGNWPNGGPGCPYDRTLWLPAGNYSVNLVDCYGDAWQGPGLIFRDTITNTVIGSGTITSGFFGSFSFTVPATTTFSNYFNYPGEIPAYKDLVIRGNYVDFSNNTFDVSYNIVTNSILSDPSNNASILKLESFNRFEFGGNDDTNTAGLDYGIVTTDSYVYTTKDGGANWEKKLSVNRVDLVGQDGSGNVRGTLGAYIEKNKKKNGSGNYVYDNSGMYIQTSTEPWNGIPGLTLAYNNSDYDLSFTPLNTYGLKTTTWDPSLNNYKEFWNVKVPNNNGRPVLWRESGNTIKTYIDDVLSTKDKYEYRQKFWTFDSFSPGDVDVNSIGLNNNKEATLYLKDSELHDNWQKIDFSVVDPSLNEYSHTYFNSWDSFTEYDCSYSIINFPYIPQIVDTNQYSGFYKLGKVPFQAFLTVLQPPTNLYGVQLTIKYKVNESLIYEPVQYKNRLNFSELGIYSNFEQIKNPSNPLSQWEAVSVPIQDYELIIPQLQAGAKYEFRVRLSNDYGFGWYSNITNFIEIPSPQPNIQNLNIEHSFFENVITWTPTFESFAGVTNVQTVYSYDIEKKYLDASNNWITDLSFSNFYEDISGVLDGAYGDLSGVQITGPYDPTTETNNLPEITSVKIVDTDLSLNTYYMYSVTSYSLVKDKQGESSISQLVDSGYPINSQTNYTVDDASMNITWTISSDISSNTDVVWDISWSEIQDNGTVDYPNTFSYTDPYKGQNNSSGKERKVTLPISNNHLLSDASYNIQIKATYTNNTLVTDYSGCFGSSSSIQALPYIDNVLLYYNYQEPPVLDGVNYYTGTNVLDISWNPTYIPSSPSYYDLSMSNITTNRTDVSYNFTVNSNFYRDLDGTSYYPGNYNIRVRSAYGSSVILFSKWSNQKTLSSIPEHLPRNFTTISYDSNNNETRYDVSYVKLSWEHPGINKFNIQGFTIPKNYYFERYTTSKDYLEFSEFTQTVPHNDISFNDTVYPITNNTQYKPTPRIYKYILKTSYE